MINGEDIVASIAVGTTVFAMVTVASIASKSIIFVFATIAVIIVTAFLLGYTLLTLGRITLEVLANV